MASDERDLDKIRELRSQLRQQVAVGEQPDPEVKQELRDLLRATGAAEALGEDID